MCVIHKTQRKINIQGIDNHEVTGLDVVTAATLLNTSQGKVNEYAYLGRGSSIHSSRQLEWFKTNVDEKSVKVGGTQLITTLDGYSVPLLIKDGSSMFWFAIFVFRMLKCEAVNFDKYSLACANGTSISNFWHAIFN